MIYLDANAFYWYLGREKLAMQLSVPKHDVEKLRNYLDSRNDKSIPASVFMEMIVHFRDNPEAIRKIIEFREVKELRIYNNLRGYCFTPDELTVLHMTKCDSVLKQYAYKLLDSKIEIEVRHTYTFVQVVSLLYVEYYLKSCHSLDCEVKDKVLSYLGRDLSDELKDSYCSELTLALKNGYSANNKSQQYLKKKYMELLVQNCVIFQMVIDTVLKFLEEEEDLYEVMCKSVSDARENGFTDDGIMKIIVDALAADSVFLKFAENEIADIFLRKGYSRHQSQYLKLMLEAWLERGQKLKKNDIFDMLCVGALDKMERNPELNALYDQNSYLISFDETMMKFICKDRGNASLINRFMCP